jgi:hypothetical protein
MRFLNTAKHGLVLITILGWLGTASPARADPPPSSTVSAPASSPPVTTPPPATATGTAIATTATTATTPSTATTPPTATTPAATTPPQPTPGTTTPATAAVPVDATTTAASTPPSEEGTTGTPATPPSSPSGPSTPATPPSPPPTPPTAPATPATAPAPSETATTPPSTPSTPPTDPGSEPPAPGPGADPSGPAVAPPPAPVASTSTTQAIVQVQISACLSDCQGISQIQQASQTTVDVQTAGASAPQASEPEGATSPAQATTSITQIQIGCLAQCFGTTTSGSAPEPLAQQILAELGALSAPGGQATPNPLAGTDQITVNQTTCQLQTGPAGPGTDTQSATQSITTVQSIALLPSPASGSATTATGAVDQTGQQTWQLQIGCLFYCTDTQQVQQAEQTITTIQILVEPPGSSTADVSTPPATGAVAVSSQVIWQLQIGCLAYCYDATQVQNATSQVTVTVATIVPPEVTPPPAGAAGGGSPAESPTGQVAAGAVPAPAGTTEPSTSAAIVAKSGPAMPLSRSMTPLGLAVLDARRSTTVEPAPASSAPLAVGSPPTLEASATATPATFLPSASRTARPVSARRDRDQQADSGDVPAAAASEEAVAGRTGSSLPIILLALGSVAGAVLIGLARAQARGRGR